MKHEKSRHEEIHLGTHGEDYGSWMSNPVFYMIGGLLALSVVLAVLSFTVFRLPWLGAVFSVAAAAFLALLCWCGWIRKQYAFGGGGMMERTHQCLLAHLGFDGKGTLLDVGCGSGALSIRRPSPGRKRKSPVSTIGAWHTATASHVREERRQ